MLESGQPGRLKTPPPSPTGTRLLNIGCGPTIHPAWTNIDLVAMAPGVISHDVRRGIPFADASFDAVYASHVVEHLTPREALRLLQEGRRVLRSGGTLRLVVPDLEGIVRAYLGALARAQDGAPGGAEDHAWMVLELIDQMVRTQSGGDMAAFLERKPFPNREFVVSRIGREAEKFWAARPHGVGGQGQRLRAVVSRLRRAIAAAGIAILGGRDARATFLEARFRARGEVHRWMYDRLSLGRLMESAGFADPRVVGPEESRIPDFAAYALDSDGGRPRKPDSLYMEAVRP
jgi:predicted SAM-dependent methyltransferase